MIQGSWTPRDFAANRPQTFNTTWLVPISEPLGAHQLHVARHCRPQPSARPGCVPRPEVRPVNQRPNRFGDIPNQTRGVAGAWVDNDPTKAPFTARVDGDFVGTTDEIIQWVACKWGVDEDYVRAQIVAESYWDQVNSLGDWGSSPARCDSRFPLGTDGHSGLCRSRWGSASPGTPT